MIEKEILDLFDKVFSKQYQIYPASLKEKKDQFFFMVKDKQKKYLAVAGLPVKVKESDFYADKEKSINNKENLLFQLCPLTHHNLTQLNLILNYLKPSITRMKPSFGTGDRLGIATPAHIHAFRGKNIFPVLGQLSTREITRTESSIQRVLDNAIWGCFEAGYEGPFGADADHIKDLENLQEAIDCGFTFYTLDPSDHINVKIIQINKEELRKKYQDLPEKDEMEKIYLDKEYHIGNQKLVFNQDSLAELLLTYLEAIKHVEKCYQFLKEHHKGEFELEVSIDETPNATSPLAHLWIASELNRRGVSFQNIAPHYIGDWEKGIDYIGDVDTFREEFRLHCRIASEMGGYKLSLHSGSDKFSVYPIFARETDGFFHIKTAGTSWLEAVKVIAMCQPDLYREIHNFALQCFAEDRFSYHLSTDLQKIPDIAKLKDEKLVHLFSDNNSRQLIHITYGSILRKKDEMGGYQFRNQIYKVLFENEDKHYQEVTKHIKHHLELLNL